MYARLLSRLVAVIAFTIALFAAACGVTSRWPGIQDAGTAKPDLPYPMATPIVPNVNPSIVTTLPAPNDGDLANSASLLQFVTPLVDDVEAYRLLTYGGGFRRKVIGASSTVLTVYPLGAVVVSSAGNWKVFAHTVSTVLDPTALAGGALTPSTRYWVYAYDNAGALAFTVNATGPDAGLRYMTGNTAYWYVTTFYTTTAGALVEYSQNDQHYRYAMHNDGNQLVNASSSLGTTAALTTTVPTQAVEVTLHGRLITAAPGPRYAYLFGPENAPEDGISLVGDPFNSGAGQLVTSLALSRNYTYGVLNAADAISVWVDGFSL